MLFLLQGLPPQYTIPGAIGMLLAVLVGMTIHEFAHNYVAHVMGDPGPARRGALTLNPLVHINLPGFLMFVVIGFGPLGQAYISPYNMRNPRLGYLAAVAAGPLSNLVVAIVFAIIYRVFNLSPGPFSPISAIGFIVYLIIQFNVLLFVFNLLPLYPLDGWKIVLSLLPADLAIPWERNAQTTQYIFLGLLLLSFMPVLPINPLSFLIGEPMGFIMGLLGVG